MHTPLCYLLRASLGNQEINLSKNCKKKKRKVSPYKRMENNFSTVYRTPDVGLATVSALRLFPLLLLRKSTSCMDRGPLAVIHWALNLNFLLYKMMIKLPQCFNKIIKCSSHHLKYVLMLLLLAVVTFIISIFHI